MSTLKCSRHDALGHYAFNDSKSLLFRMYTQINAHLVYFLNYESVKHMLCFVLHSGLCVFFLGLLAFRTFKPMSVLYFDIEKL